MTTRKKDQLNFLRSDLEIRYEISCDIKLFDVLDFKSHTSFYKNLKTKPDIVITCIGYLDNQGDSQNDFEESLRSIQSNFTGLVSILNIISNDFEKKGSGVIVGVSSVAGDRGRGSNYFYGSSKAAFTSYLSGLRNRLHALGVPVITKDILNSIKKGKSIIYTKWFWKWIMLIIKLIPERIFKKLRM